MMTLSQIGKLGKELTRFLALFGGCFRSRPGFALGRIYVKGLLSDLGRKNAEAIALEFDTPPRTLQRLLESIKWDEKAVRDKCQQLVAREHKHAEAIGCIDESGTAKSGDQTVGAARQWLGSCGKVENGVVGVHLSYAAPGFQELRVSTGLNRQSSYQWSYGRARTKSGAPTNSCTQKGALDHPRRRRRQRW